MASSRGRGRQGRSFWSIGTGDSQYLKEQAYVSPSTYTRGPLSRLHNQPPGDAGAGGPTAMPAGLARNPCRQPGKPVSRDSYQSLTRNPDRFGRRAWRIESASDRGDSPPDSTL